MKTGELVWVRNALEKPTWGLIVNRVEIYLTDNSVMVSWCVLCNSELMITESSDLLRFSYYNRHLSTDE